MRVLAIIFTIVNFVTISQGQDVIYSINCEKDGESTFLDSILFENLSNDSRIVFDGLPIQNSYVINLTSQELEGPTGFFNFMEDDQFFRIARNIPGEISIQVLNKNIGDIILCVHNLNGQKIYHQRISFNDLVSTLTVNIPNSGLYLLNITSDFGKYCFKVLGSNIPGTIGYTLNQEATHKEKKEHKQLSLKQVSAFSFQAGDSIRIIAFQYGNNSYPVIFSVQNSDTLNLIIETNPDKYFEINNIKFKLNMGHHIGFSEMDCGANVFAHGLYLTSDIFYEKYEWEDGGISLLPSGVGNLLIFNMYSKYSELVSGQYVFVDEVDCNGLITDDGNTYQMSSTDKVISAISEINDPTHYALNFDLDVDWYSIDISNPPAEILDRYTNYINSMVRIKEGYVNIDIDGDLYTITIDCTDVNGNVISGKYIGTLEYVEFGI